jgi:hypothetical protein
MENRISRSTRRKLVWATGAGLALGQVPYRAMAQSQTPTDEVNGTTIGAPAWSFALHVVQDPYAGQMQVPQAPPAGTRYVAAEVEVINDSNQALNFTPVEIRLRDQAGVDYRGGGAIGAEPMIGPRNLNPGERSRGWVWFIVPVAARAVEIVYLAPAPQYRVPLPS